jgi:hypothetical protein
MKVRAVTMLVLWMTRTYKYCSMSLIKQCSLGSTNSSGLQALAHTTVLLLICVWLRQEINSFSHGFCIQHSLIVGSVVSLSLRTRSQKFFLSATVQLLKMVGRNDDIIMEFYHPYEAEGFYNN